METDYLATIESYNIRSAFPNIGCCALLVVDMQDYFFPIASPILENVSSIIERCKANGIRTVYTRHGHTDPSRDGGMLAKWWGDLIRYGTEDWELIKTLNQFEADLILDKKRYSAFHGTSLDESLRSSKIDEIIITGVLTNCCCETTARDAFVKDYRVFFVSDATATVNEELHLASLKNLAFGFAHVLSTDQLCKGLSGKQNGEKPGF